MFAGFILINKSPVKKSFTFGITYSPFYAENFSLDSKETFLAILDDLGARNIRMPIYWNKIEKEEGKFDFEMIDWQLSEAQKRDAKVIIALGKKLPRWPECHVPEWANKLNEEEFNQKLLLYIKKAINRYKGNDAIFLWQIENEPFLPFGICPKIKKEIIKKEIDLVHSLDTRPILITDSGELSLWIPAAKLGDIFGTTMYRSIWNDKVGYFTYPLPPQFFRIKRSLTEFFVGEKPMIVIELQGEPWHKKMNYQVSIREQYELMDPETFKDNINYAKKSGFDVFYLWGVEWWYWLKKEGDSRIWDFTKTLFNN